METNKLKIRPKVVVGDIVKLSKKGKRNILSNLISKNKTLRVLDVKGDGVSRTSEIICCVGQHKISLYRNEVWKTGYNVSKEVAVAQTNTSDITNNDGRTHCYLCGMPTQLVADTYNLCKNSSCSWFEN